MKEISSAILKAIAVIFVVVANAGGPQWLVQLAALAGIPVFFLFAGYSFDVNFLDSPKSYLWDRFRRIYWPFWSWSLIFLCLHNLFLGIGFLSESYGDALGAALQPYDAHDFFQNLWSITFNMSGYDCFMAGTFWVFRTLFISSLAFELGLILLRKFSKWKTPTGQVGIISCMAFMMALWMVLGELQVTGIHEGGYREVMAVFFMGMGFLYHEYQKFIRPQWLVVSLGLFLLIFFVWQWPSSLSPVANFQEFIALPLPAISAFVLIHALAVGLSQYHNIFTKGLVYIGNRALYVLAFHLLAFKLVSMFKVLVYGLPWTHVGGYPVVHENGQEDFFFVLYIVVGVSLPLLVMEGWKKMDAMYNLTWFNCIKYTSKGIGILLVFIWNILKKVFCGVGRSVKGFFTDIKEFIKASNPKDE